MVESLLKELMQRTRNDANKVHAVAADEFTPPALYHLFVKCQLFDEKVSKTLQTSYRIKLMTHVQVIKRDGSVVPRLMMWVTEGKGAHKDTIIVTPYSLKDWMPAAFGEEEDEILAAGKWVPSRFSSPGFREKQTHKKKSADDLKKMKESFRSLFCLPPPSVLPDFMTKMPQMPVGAAPPQPFFFSVSHVQSVDFTEDTDTDMVVRLKRTEEQKDRIPSVYVRFACDTGREMWRRELRKIFFSHAKECGIWQETLLPDLSDNSRRKQELL